MTCKSKSFLPFFLLVCVLWSSSIGTSFFVSQLMATQLVETRGQALLVTMVAGQCSDGSFPFFEEPATYGWVSSTGQSLLVLNILGALNKVNVTAAIVNMISKQNRSHGGFGTPDELWDPYIVALSLGSVGAVTQINNRSGLVNFVLSHYNNSEGAFFEPGQRCAFPILMFDVHSYGRPNVISTFLAVSTLKALDALDVVNASKTADWVLSTLVSTSPDGGSGSAAFTPYRTLLPNYGFETDRYGGGLPYTYAAIETLQVLGQLDRLGDFDRERIAKYIFESQDPYSGGFYVRHVTATEPRAAGMNPELMYTYYAIMALNALNTLGDTRFQQNITMAVNSLMRKQNMFYLPPLTPQESVSYGLFLATGGRDNAESNFMAISSLNITGNLYLLSLLTWKSLDAIGKSNITILALSLLAATMATAIIVYMRRRRTRSQDR